MKRLIFVIVALALSVSAHAGGLLYAVESFQKAQALAKQDAAKHVLVFYTSDS